MSIEKREIKGESVEFDTRLGGAVVHHANPNRVEGGHKAALTAKRHAKKEDREEAEAQKKSPENHEPLPVRDTNQA